MQHLLGRQVYRFSGSRRLALGSQASLRWLTLVLTTRTPLQAVAVGHADSVGRVPSWRCGGAALERSRQVWVTRPRTKVRVEGSTALARL